MSDTQEPVNEAQALSGAGPLSTIADVIDGWLKWSRKTRSDEGLATDHETKLITLPVPEWPSHGVLERWVAVLRAADLARSDAPVVKAGPLAYVIAEMLERAGQHRPNGDILHEILVQALPAEREAPQPVPSVREYCTCNSKTNPCIVCGKPKFIDPEWLKRKLETDPDEGEIGAGFELFASPLSPAHGAVEALRRLIVAAKILKQNAEGCAVNHYGDDYHIHGEPGWLADCRRDIEAAEAALAQPAAQEGWRSMESAPKDGTRILIKFVHTNAKYSEDPVGEGWIAVHEAYWIDHNGGGWTWHGLCGVAEKWMPLPLPAARARP